jgi:hypothetical protein
MGLEPFNVASALNLDSGAASRAPHLPEVQGQVRARRRRAAGAKVTRDTTLRDLRFTEEALQDAKRKATPKEAVPFLENSRSTRASASSPSSRGAAAMPATAPDSRVVRVCTRSCS